jgi:hypothetical protein
MDKSQKLKIKSEILDCCILPALLYGVQTWTLTQQQKSALQVTQRKMERKILQITPKDHIRNNGIRRKTQAKDAARTAQIMKRRWAGHVVRLDHRRWAHATTLWDPRNGLRGTWKTKYEMGGRHEEASRKPMDQKSEEHERWEELRESDKSASVSARVYESSRHR